MLTEPVPRGVPTTSSRDVQGAPLPGHESGRIDGGDGGDGGDSVPRRFFRGLLLLPRMLVDVAFFPVRGALWADDRYLLHERYRRTFFSRDDTKGMYPMIGYESGFRPRGGLRIFDRDMFGAQERLSLTGEVGTSYQARIEGSLRSGRRLGRVELELRGIYDRQPQEYFFGIGNGDEVTTAPMLIDPLTSDVAVETRYRSRLERATAIADIWLWRALHMRIAGALSELTFAESDLGPPIGMVYDVTGLVGFAGGVSAQYTEAALHWDDRDRGSSMEPRSVYADGSLASVFAGRETLLSKDGGFWRYGGDLQHFIRIAEGPRVVSAHLYGEAVHGPVDEVPFVDLPRLGGPKLLRGYRTDRFRDRVAAAGALEYRWDLSRYIQSSVFVDVGRVSPSLSELSFDDLRVGYGAALELHSDTTYLANLSVASSIDGGLFFYLSFDPVFDLDERVRRR